MSEPATFLVALVVLVCGYTAFSFFKRAMDVNAAKVKSTPKVVIKAIRFRYNLIVGVIMAFFALSGLVWIIKNW